LTILHGAAPALSTSACNTSFLVGSELFDTGETMHSGARCLPPAGAGDFLDKRAPLDNGTVARWDCLIEISGHELGTLFAANGSGDH
jgi:hypothetical protein